MASGSFGRSPSGYECERHLLQHCKHWAPGPWGWGGSGGWQGRGAQQSPLVVPFTLAEPGPVKPGTRAAFAGHGAAGEHSSRCFFTFNVT